MIRLLEPVAYQCKNAPPQFSNRRHRVLDIKNLTFVLLVLCFSALSTGCNTISGIGEDLQAAGEAIQNTAEDVQED